MSTGKFAIIAQKITTEVDIVFAMRDDLGEATSLAERLVTIGLKSRVEQVRPGTAWPGMTWPVRQTVRE